MDEKTRVEQVRKRIEREIEAMGIGDLVHKMIAEYDRDEPTLPAFQNFEYQLAHKRLNEMFRMPETEPDVLRMLNDGDV